MIEIERKYLVQSDAYKSEASQKFKIVQGYLNSDPERSVRVRIKGEKGFLTVKGKSNTSGTSRFEWEKEIPLKEAKELLSLCEPGIIEKIRYLIPAQCDQGSRHIFEVDEFKGENTGLVVAEVELSFENEKITKPAWLGEEITGRPQYYNSALSQKPFQSW